MPSHDQKLTRIAVFYDGNFFLHVSNYYHYNHPRRARISISGLHHFIRLKVAESENSDVRYCQIVDAHYFRGRIRAQDAQQRDILLKERIFDDVLVREGVTTHYLPLGPDGEKGIDVWLALEAYELAIYKQYDVTVLIASDGDFLPLVRKLNTIGTRIMLLGWDFRFTDHNGFERETRTAQSLLDEATYPLMMHQIIDDRSLKNDSMINGIFVIPREIRTPIEGPALSPLAPGIFDGVIQNIKQGYGFISPIGGGQNLFFYHADVVNTDFNELTIGERVRYELGENEKGACAVRIRVSDGETET